MTPTPTLPSDSAIPSNTTIWGRGGDGKSIWDDYDFNKKASLAALERVNKGRQDQEQEEEYEDQYTDADKVRIIGE